MTIFEYDDYKKWIKEHINAMEKSGRGQFTKIANHLNVSPTIITQIFAGPRELSPEHAVLLAEYFMLSKIEKKYLILLVNFARAGSEKYRLELKEDIKEIRILAQNISRRVTTNAELTEETMSILYSNWYYIAIWSLVAIEGYHVPEKISKRLNISRIKTREALDFLIKHSIVIIDSENKLKMGPTLIHLPSSSPQAARNNQNWRLKAFNKYEEPGNSDLFYTGVMTLSESDVITIRETILQFISKTVNTVKDSPSECLYCFCTDWFEV